jgi:hypothetical protein
MSRYELRALAEAVVVTRDAVGWDRPLQTFFAQLFSLDDEGNEHALVWTGTFPRELGTAAAALAVVASDCVIPDGLAAKLETDRLASFGAADGPAQTIMKATAIRPNRSQ